MDNSWLLAWHPIFRHAKNSNSRSPRPHLKPWEGSPCLSLDFHPSLFRELKYLHSPPTYFVYSYKVYVGLISGEEIV